MIFDEIWSSLESEPRIGGDYRRRIHPESVSDLWLFIHHPGDMRGLLIDLDFRADEVVELPKSAGIEVRFRSSGGATPSLEVVLTQPAFTDLFDTLVADIAATAARAKGRTQAATNVAGRIKRWQAFLKESPDGLSEERQRGLFGELIFLQLHLLPTIDPVSAVTAWTGPAAANQDFGLGSVAIEAKTTMAKQHQRLRIASERQLDSTGLDTLMLFHLSVDCRDGAGLSLTDLIADLREALAPTPIAAAGFEDGLFAAGFLDTHASRYHRMGYTIRASFIYLVDDDFPRIVETDCPVGVGDVSYSLAASALTPFVIDADEAHRLIKRGVK